MMVTLIGSVGRKAQITVPECEYTSQVPLTLGVRLEFEKDGKRYTGIIKSIDVKLGSDEPPSVWLGKVKLCKN